jgi:tetratricopeptide (TPR) repeat protein
MGLPAALKAHGARQFDEAEAQYRRAYQQGQVNAVFYQNFGSLLNKQGKAEESRRFFEEGLSRYPSHPGILRNYANQLRRDKPCYAIELYLSAIRSALCNESDVELAANCLDDLIDLMRRQHLRSWSLALIDNALSYSSPSALLLMNLLVLIDSDEFSSDLKQVVIDDINYQLKEASLLKAITLDFSLATHYLAATEHQRCLSYFESGLNRIRNASSIPESDRVKIQELVDSNSWNFACASLALQDLKNGWQLFEHGLRTPAEGQQRWQRALVKPFSATDLPLWRGEQDLSQRLLVLEEQAIGDGMMFLTLAPRLLNETSHLGIFLSPRLESIYRRSFADEINQGRISIFTKNDITSGRLVANQFDRQTPLGSICQYRFLRVQDYAPRVPILIADERDAARMRSEYLAVNRTPKRLVGVSWQGGGRGVRIQQKSLAVDLFAELMLQHPDVRFIDLQYGNTARQIKAWQQQGIDIVHDPRVNPLVDMDLWLSQVKACDGVISVANTTIHGAGGLNLPTQCLLSIHSDWRWFVDPSVQRSYWYPSVGIARQSKTLRPSWQQALNQVSAWLLEGCPMPSGACESNVR